MTTAQDGGKVVSLTHRLPLPPGNTPGTHFCKRLSRPQGRSATGRIMSLENSNDTIGNRTRDLNHQHVLVITTTIIKVSQRIQMKYTINGWSAQVKPSDVMVNIVGAAFCNAVLVYVLLKQVKFKLLLTNRKNGVCLCCWMQFMCTLLNGSDCNEIHSTKVHSLV